jgi:hypothetical protein
MRLLLLMTVAVSAAVCWAAEPVGWLQINAAAGTRVLVDGEFVGTTALVPSAETEGEFTEEEAMLDELIGEPAALEELVPEPALPTGNNDPLDEDWGEVDEGGGEADPAAAAPPAEPPAFLVVGPLSVGEHLVRTELAGRPSREQSVTVEAAIVTLVTVPAEGAELAIVEDGPEAELAAEQETGVLEVVSLPIESFVQLGELEPALKSKPLWRAEAMPAGEVSVTVIGMDGISVSETVTVVAGKRIRLLADLQNGIMRDLTAESEAEVWLSAQKGQPLTLPSGQKLLWHEDGFWLAQGEVTAAQFAAYAEPEKFGDSPVGPRSSVSREEAHAYCGWLTEQAREKSAIPPGWALQLPTKVQWLAASAVEGGGWEKLFGGVAEWTTESDGGLAVILGGSDNDASKMARGTDGTPGRRARGTDKLTDVGFRIVLAPEEVTF